MALKASGTDALLVDHHRAIVVRVHPVVVFSILDHFTRRQERGQRVIGTLLGTVVNDVVEVSNCFGVPHQESAGEVKLGQDYHRSMCKSLSRINEKEKIVGWYATSDGKPINANSNIIHGFYVDEVQKDREKLIHLVVDTSLSTGRVGIKAYVSTPVVIQGDGLANTFDQVRLEIKSTEPERVCIDRMIKGQDMPWSSSETTASVVKESEDSLDECVKTLKGMLDNVSDYVDKVVKGEEEPNSAIGCQIADAISAVPRIRPELFDQIFNSNLQDMLMVSYFSSLTKANLAIADRIIGVSTV